MNDDDLDDLDDDDGLDDLDDLEPISWGWLHVLANFWRIRRRTDDGVTLWYYHQPRRDEAVVFHISVSDDA